MATKTPATAAARKRPAKSGASPALLAGDNPQIPKGYGDAPVQAYIAAIPGWKRETARRIDALIVRAVPDVTKAVKWNSPLYGAPGAENAGTWFISMHCFTRYVKVAFFHGAKLRPVPPVASKQEDVRYLHIHEHDEIDEAQFVEWVKQASVLPGQRM
jgi:hypothetical protein